jgi:hypothetical protein
MYPSIDREGSLQGESAPSAAALKDFSDSRRSKKDWSLNFRPTQACRGSRTFEDGTRRGIGSRRYPELDLIGVEDAGLADPVRSVGALDSRGFGERTWRGQDLVPSSSELVHLVRIETHAR